MQITVKIDFTYRKVLLLQDTGRIQELYKDQIKHPEDYFSQEAETYI